MKFGRNTVHIALHAMKASLRIDFSTREFCDTIKFLMKAIFSKISVLVRLFLKMRVTNCKLCANS